MNLKPTRDYVLLKPDEKETTTASGILVATTKKEAPSTGVVMAIGSEVVDIAVNDRVYYGQYDFDYIEIDGQKLQLGKAGNIFAIFE